MIDLLKSIDENIEDEKYWVAGFLIRHGSSFSSAIGRALLHSDLKDTILIKKTWPETWESTLLVTEERRKNKDYY